MTTTIARLILRDRLGARRGEIEQAIRGRVYAIADPLETADPLYAEGLRAAVSTALDYGLAAIESGGERALAVPVTLLSQAHLAARNGVSLDTVLRRYFAGYSLLGEYLIEETEREEPIERMAFKQMLRAHAEVFDRLLTTVGEEYERARHQDRPESPSERRRRLVEGLLTGRRTDAAELHYSFGAWHLGLIATGPAGGDLMRAIAQSVDAHLLLVKQDREVAWAWLGASRPLELARPELQLASSPASGVRIALGEPARGLAGWRRTHHQAAAALPIARRGPASFALYRDVALLAAAYRDELLRSSLEQIFIAPLAAERDGGVTLRETLNAYFVAHRNAASAAAALRVSRQTVNNRLRTAEERLGRPLESCVAELQTALRLEALSKRQPD